VTKADRIAGIEQADMRHVRCRPNGYHRFLKRAKLRSERRKAKANPECYPTYRRFRGWES
jgi:hypothetical protein